MPEEVSEENANKRARTDVRLNPHDESLRSSPLITCLNVVSLKTLEKENQTPCNKRFFDAMLLRIIPLNVNLQDTKLGSLRMYGPRKNTSSNAHYSRLFLCKVFSSEENQRLFYLMESRNSNNHIWTRNPQLRDDGTITIGTLFRILSPMPIKSLMSGDLPMVVTRFPVIVMKYPDVPVPTVDIDHYIGGNAAMAFV